MPAKKKIKKGAKKPLKRKKVMYKCVFKQQKLHKYVTQIENEHGAKNDIWHEAPVWDIVFNYEAVTEQYTEPVGTLVIHHSLTTMDTVLADKYMVGGLYDDLPVAK